MIKYDLIFSHGWGLGAWFWDPLIRIFCLQNYPIKRLHVIDYGYTASPKYLPSLSNNYILISHSMGWINFQTHYPDFFKQVHAVVMLSSFGDFLLPNKKIRMLMLKKMIHQWNINPKKTWYNFLKNSGLSPTSLPTSAHPSLSLSLNNQLLQHDLNLLFKNYTLPQVPSLWIATLTDSITPILGLYHQFKSLSYKDKQFITLWHGEHSLPYLNPQLVYTILHHWINTTLCTLQ